MTSARRTGRRQGRSLSRILEAYREAPRVVIWEVTRETRRELTPIADRVEALEAVTWEGFRRHSDAELEREPELVEELLEIHRRGTLTLVYGARDTGHNNAEAVRRYLQTRADGGD